MKFAELFRFELAHQLGRPAVWISGLLVFLMTLGLSYGFAVSNGDGLMQGFSDIYVNSPLMIATTASLASIFSMLLVAVMAGDAAARDQQARQEPLLFTMPLRPIVFLLARWLGLLLPSVVLVVVLVPLAIWSIQFLPEAQPERMGPWRTLSLLQTYGFLVVPNLVIMTALLYATAVNFRKTTVPLVAAFLLAFSCLLTADLVYKEDIGLAKLLDLSGFAVLRERMQTSSFAVQRDGLLGLPAALASNRGLWLAVAFGAMLLTSLCFDFRHHSTYTGRPLWLRFRRKRSLTAQPVRVTSGRTILPRYDAASQWRQLRHYTWRQFAELVAKKWLLGLLAALAFFVVQLLPGLLEGDANVPTEATPGAVIGVYGSVYLQLFVALLIVALSGQLVWRERDNRMQDLTDTAAIPDWVLLLGKCLALLLVVCMVQALLYGSALLLQSQAGNASLDYGVLATYFFGLRMVDLLLLLAASFTVHVLVNQRYLGLVLLLVLVVYLHMPEYFGVQHPLLIYGSDLGLAHTEVGSWNRIGPWLGFKAYWLGWAILLAVAARLLWVRSREQDVLKRLHIARGAIRRPVLLAAAIGLLLLSGAGAYLLYQIHFRNDYLTAADMDAQQVQFERKYGQLRNLPQPLLVATKLYVELHPAEQSATIQGQYTLRNRTNTPITTIQLHYNRSLKTQVTKLSLPGKVTLNDDAHGLQLVTLAGPLAPGDSLIVDFQVAYAYRGISLPYADPKFTSAAGYVDGKDWLPHVGYQLDKELFGAGKRKQYGLPPQQGYLLDDSLARYDLSRNPAARFEATIATDSHHMAVTHGELIRTWQANGRSYWHYRSAVPVPGFPLLSAPFQTAADTVDGVRLAVHYYPGQDENVPRMLHSLKATLRNMARTFGAYQHRTLRLVQYPGTATYLKAYSGLIIYPEAFARKRPDLDNRGFDHVYSVIAHEVAHQWFAHQLTPAEVEGAGLLTETFAWHTALNSIAKEQGEQVKLNILRAMKLDYLTPSSRAAYPLLRSRGHFQFYRLGPFAMHTLATHVGDSAINRAIVKLLSRFPPHRAPMPRSRDLYAELQHVVPDSLHPLVHDLFAQNTWWNLKIAKARATELPDGQYEVQLEVRASKDAVDTTGVATSLPMDEWVEIALIGYQPQPDGNFIRDTLYFQPHRVHNGLQHLRLVVPKFPARAVIDPRHLFQDSDFQDNGLGVKLPALAPAAQQP